MVQITGVQPSFSAIQIVTIFLHFFLLWCLHDARIYAGACAADVKSDEAAISCRTTSRHSAASACIKCSH